MSPGKNHPSLHALRRPNVRGALALLLLVGACGGDDDGGVPPDAGLDAAVPDATTGYDWNLPGRFPLPQVPEDNPMSDEKVALGRHLFYDERLSGNGTQACASCHLQELAFADGKITPAGSTGEALARNSPGLGNAAYYSTLTWPNPLLQRLEQQILIPLYGEAPVELGATGNEEIILERLRGEPVYQQLFAAVFPEDADPYQWGNIVDALAAFVRSMITGRSRYDAYVYEGEEDALSEAELRGMALFFSERLECHHCHGGFNFSTATTYAGKPFVELAFANIGLYNLDAEGTYPPGNQGLWEFTGQAGDKGKFRAPSLRNVAVTAPYMHDGSVASLEDVIRHYESAGRNVESGPYVGDGRENPNKSGFLLGFTLTDEERADLLAFLESLTDETLLTDPRFSSPWPPPSGAAPAAGAAVLPRAIEARHDSRSCARGSCR
jgi:cytochrome c peroxidase